MNSADPIPLAKESLRRMMRAGLRELTPARIEADSAKIRTRLATADEWMNSPCILGFVALATEPDLLTLLSSAATTGHVVALPRWNAGTGSYEAAEFPLDGSLVPGPFGVLEPPRYSPTVPFERLDLIVVPGLAFDRYGRRLGRGKGFFDRLLVKAERARRWGVAFDQQLVTEVPCALHDVHMHLIVTPGLFLPTTDGRVR